MIAPKDLLQRADSGLLAQVATPTDDDLIAPDRLRTIITASSPTLNPAETAALARINQALSDAESTVNSYINASYTEVPGSLVNATCAIAMWYLHSYAGGDAPEDITNRYDRAIVWLKDIAAGRASLPPDDNATDEDSDGEPDTPDGVQFERQDAFMDFGGDD